MNDCCGVCDDGVLEWGDPICAGCYRRAVDKAKALERLESEVIDAMPGTPVRIWMHIDKDDPAQVFVKVNVGGWQRGTTFQATGDPLASIAACLESVMAERAASR